MLVLATDVALECRMGHWAFRKRLRQGGRFEQDHRFAEHGFDYDYEHKHEASLAGASGGAERQTGAAYPKG